MRHKRKAPFVDFKKLSEKEARELSIEWEKNATFFEFKLEKYLIDNPDSELENDVVLKKYFSLANSLWKKLISLDNHIQKTYQTSN